MELLDIAAFISEIQQRPAIWDVRCCDYSNKEQKRNAWEEIVTLFIGDENVSVAEKREFGQKLQRRWKSLRDSFAREMRIQKQSKSGSGPRKRPAYIYLKQLSFLETVVRTQSVPNSLEDDDVHSQPMLSRSTSPISKRKKIDPASGRLVIAAEKSVKAREEREKEAEKDCDRLFLLSLLDPLKQIPEYARFGTKRRLMDVLESELQLYQQTVATPPPAPQVQLSPHQFHRANLPNTSVYTQLSPLNRPNTSFYNEGRVHFTSNLQQLRVEVKNNSPQSSSSTIASPLSDYELFDEQ